MLSDIYDKYDKYSNTAMYKIVFSRLLHRKLLIVNSFFPGAQVILEWLQCLYKKLLSKMVIDYSGDILDNSQNNLKQKKTASDNRSVK